MCNSFLQVTVFMNSICVSPYAIFVYSSNGVCVFAVHRLGSMACCIQLQYLCWILEYMHWSIFRDDKTLFGCYYSSYWYLFAFANICTALGTTYRGSETWMVNAEGRQVYAVGLRSNYIGCLFILVRVCTMLYHQRFLCGFVALCGCCFL